MAMPIRRSSPFGDVRGPPDTHRSPGVYGGTDGVIETSADDHLLVLLGSARLDTSNKASSYPNTCCPITARDLSTIFIRCVCVAREAHDKEAARPRPSATAPAATTITCSPVRGLFLPLTISTVAGMRMENGVSPVCPPPSPPCAQIMSTPIGFF